VSAVILPLFGHTTAASVLGGVGWILAGVLYKWSLDMLGDFGRAVDEIERLTELVEELKRGGK
jgi:uncharacterized protein (DUF697 family)